MSLNNWTFLKFLLIQTETNLILSNVKIMKLYANLDDNQEESALFMSKILTDYENGRSIIEYLFDEHVTIRRKGQYDNLHWRNDKLNVLHKLHIKHLQQWRSITDENSKEKNEILKKLLSLINSVSSGLKNTG